jgi:hypothetical protein
MYIFSTKTAEADTAALWKLQEFLLMQCEGKLGQKAWNKKVYKPIFKGDRPHIINDRSGDGAFAALSSNAKSYWPTTLYELAHETVHLLNPVIDYTNFLEEGFAVYFSKEMSEIFTSHPMEPKDEGSGAYYVRAHELVLQLPEPIYNSGKLIRQRFGSLGGVQSDQLSFLFPQLSSNVVAQLTQECNFTDSLIT